jgi:sugar phosphate isomerase/epimerase
VSASQLTYCTNIHPGESLAEVREVLATHVSAVRRRVSPGTPFGVGLRLSAAAASELEAEGELERFRVLLAEHGLFVFTLNGFPYGGFHGQRVKERVYTPDWRAGERGTYSTSLARILAALLPASCAYGSVSTVPVGFRADVDTEQAHALAASRLHEHAAQLVELARQTDRELVLALEPEPFCALETTADAVAFFEQHLFAKHALADFAARTGLSTAAAEEALRRHVGVCLDACHAAVVYESPAQSVGRLEAAGIRIAKLQISAGLEVELGPGRESARALRRFADDVYLHQVFEQSARGSERYLDLPEALAQAEAAPELARQWRIHFHVPVFAERLGEFASTQPALRELLARQRERPFTEHLEVETYTWDVLPEEHRAVPVTDAIARELAWARAELAP